MPREMSAKTLRFPAERVSPPKKDKGEENKPSSTESKVVVLAKKRQEMQDRDSKALADMRRAITDLEKTISTQEQYTRVKSIHDAIRQLEALIHDRPPSVEDDEWQKFTDEVKETRHTLAHEMAETRAVSEKDLLALRTKFEELQQQLANLTTKPHMKEQIVREERIASLREQEAQESRQTERLQQVCDMDVARAILNKRMLPSIESKNNKILGFIPRLQSALEPYLSSTYVDNPQMQPLREVYDALMKRRHIGAYRSFMQAFQKAESMMANGATARQVFPYILEANQKYLSVQDNEAGLPETLESLAEHNIRQRNVTIRQEESFDETGLDSGHDALLFKELRILTGSLRRNIFEQLSGQADKGKLPDNVLDLQYAPAGLEQDRKLYDQLMARFQPDALLIFYAKLRKLQAVSDNGDNKNTLKTSLLSAYESYFEDRNWEKIEQKRSRKG